MTNNPTIDGVSRAKLEQALKLAAVFDDGSDGADAESAQRVVGILRALLDAPAPVAAVPDERAKFESSYAPEALERDGDEYVRMPVQMAWEGWLARACLDATASLNEGRK